MNAKRPAARGLIAAQAASKYTDETAGTPWASLGADRSRSTVSVILCHRACRNKSLRNIALDCGAFPHARVSVAAAASGLHQKAFAGSHFIAARGRRLELV